MARRTLRSCLLTLAVLGVAGCDATANLSGLPLKTFNPNSAIGKADAPGQAQARPEQAEKAEKTEKAEKETPEVTPEVPAAKDEAAEAPVEVAEEAPSDDPLKAGSVDDNAKFPEFLSYQKRYDGEKMRALDVSERYVIRVVDAAGKSVPNADVSVAVGDKVLMTGKSYANGQLLFHPKVYSAAGESFQVTAAQGANRQTVTFAPNQEGVWELKLPQGVEHGTPKMEVLFMIDATGSMGGEIERLQETIGSISNRIKGLTQSPTVKFGLVSYRDQEDDYVTQKTDFTGDIKAFKLALDKTEAEGGGDYAEDMEAALAVAMNGMEWDPNPDTVRLTFLVADAPPHVDYAQSVPYTSSVKRAAEKGIKVYPVGCSGLAPEGEFVMRQLAQFTMGQYLFITRGGDEFSGGGEVSHTVDKFKEGRLDDIVVDIVKAELNALGN